MGHSLKNNKMTWALIQLQSWSLNMCTTPIYKKSMCLLTHLKPHLYIIKFKIINTFSSHIVENVVIVAWLNYFNQNMAWIPSSNMCNIKYVSFVIQYAIDNYTS